MRSPPPLRRLIALMMLVALLATPNRAEAERERRLLRAGTAEATEAVVQTAEQPGPTVVIVGGMHGNEPAGAAAAEQISRWPIQRGVLICIPRANVTALEAGKRRSPAAESDLADLNRNFPRVTGPQEPRGELAAEMWRLVAEARPDWLLDLHEGFAVHRQNSDSVGSSVIADKTPASREVARELLTVVNEPLEEKSRFVLLGPPVNGSLARAAHEHLGAGALILETTFSTSKLPVRARQHRIMVRRFLERLDMLGDDVTSESGLLEPASESVVRVALYNDAGVGGNGVGSLLEQLSDGQRFAVAQVCGADVAAGALSEFDLLICSGGSGSGQARSLGEAGRAEVRRFVREGGDYIGICAGSYLACGGFSWGLGILDAETVSPRWRRGRASLPLALTDEARELFDWPEASAAVRYHNGPIIRPLEDPQIPDYRPLATFAEEIAENGAPAGVMLDSPAIVIGDFGRGQVLAISPHPEQTERCQRWLPRAVDHLTELPAAAAN